MSSYKDQVIECLKSFDNTNYESVKYKEFETKLKERYQDKVVDVNFILDAFKEAFSNGFHGFHFMDEYEHMVNKFLEKLFGDELYIKTRLCNHGKICLQINFEKLKLRPEKCLTYSYKNHENHTFADFCYNLA